MLALSIVLATVLLLFLLLLLPIRFHITYHTDDELPHVRLQILFFHHTLFPQKEKKPKLRGIRRKKRRKRQKKAEGQSAKISAKKKKPNQKRSILSTVQLIYKLLKGIYSRFIGRLHIRIDRLKIAVATDDAAKTAILYGGVSQTVSYILAFCEEQSNLQPIKEKNVSVSADFLSDKTTADVHICLWLRLVTALHLLFRLAINFTSNK
ncbi:MAG: DUF2953 domain-containing protein [Clostridia bacterium]|nr:DUF2953 domain-containing protein [Clostridia bacterium]